MTLSVDPWSVIPPEEFTRRQRNARQAAQEADLDGLVVYSRGGGFLDMHADVFYLTNHYSQLPYVADHFGLSTAASHAAVLLPVDGPSVLVVDVPWWRRDLVVADDVRESEQLTQAVGQALRHTHLYGKRVGLVGVEFMTASAYLGLLEVAGTTHFVRIDDAIERLRIRTSAAERELIRAAAAIGSRAVAAMMEAATEGNTEATAVYAGLDVVASSGAMLYDATCSSGSVAHHYAWARLPSYDAHRRLSRGDVLHVDCYGAYGGYLWDFGRTRVVGGAASEAQHDFIEATIEGVDHVCRALRPGVTGDEVYTAARTWLAESPQGRRLSRWLPASASPAHVGHGIGLSWSAPWLMKGDRTVLEPGTYLAVEMLFGQEGVGAALHEENGLVTEDGFEVLTTTRKRYD
jgi:ectoine hydrolase